MKNTRKGRRTEEKWKRNKEAQKNKEKTTKKVGKETKGKSERERKTDWQTNLINMEVIKKKTNREKCKDRKQQKQPFKMNKQWHSLRVSKATNQTKRRNRTRLLFFLPYLQSSLAWKITNRENSDREKIPPFKQIQIKVKAMGNSIKNARISHK